MKEASFAAACNEANDLDGGENLQALNEYWEMALKILHLYVKNTTLSHYEIVKIMRNEIDGIELI